MKRILVVHTGGGLGDVLLATAVVDALKTAYPDCELDFLCRRSCWDVLQTNPDISELMVLDGRSPRNWLEFTQLSARLRSKRYDAALVLWSTTALAWLVWSAGIPIRVGQDSRLAYSFLYTHRVRIRSEHGDTDSHWTEILLDYVRALGVEVGPAKIRLDVPPAAIAAADELLVNYYGDYPLIGFHCTKGMRLAPGRWPIAAFAAMALALQRQLGTQLVLTGSPEDRELVRDLLVKANLRGVLNVAGRTDLLTLTALTRRCQVFVCPDSGPMHLAASQGTPVVGIYALEEDFPNRWAPYGVPHRIVRPQERNCHPGCIKATCPDFRCYYQVDPQAVVRAVGELLQVAALPPPAAPPASSGGSLEGSVPPSEESSMSSSSSEESDLGMISTGGGSST